MAEERFFGKRIKEERKKSGLFQQDLCDGLCNLGQISRIEIGYREPEKPMRDRLLGRLGIAAEDYESLLCDREYRRQSDRLQILQCLNRGSFDEMEQSLNRYWKEYDMGNPLELQFYLSMLAYWKKARGAGKQETEELFFSAAKLTVTGVSEQPKERKALSVVEIDLLLEWLRCCDSSDKLSVYERWMTYLEQKRFDLPMYVTCWPKAVYYYYLEWKEAGAKERLEGKLLRLCEQALERLQEAGRTFYRWELLDMKEDLLCRIGQNCGKQGKTFPEDLRGRLEDVRENRLCWETLCRKNGQEIKMRGYSVLSADQESYSLEEVIRIRREMFGMTPEELAKGICDVRTVQRLERRQIKARRTVVQSLLERLHLPGEVCYGPLLTGEPEAFSLYGEFLRRVREGDLEEAARRLERLGELIDLALPQNRQSMLRMEGLVRYGSGEIDRKRYLELLRDALECTIPYEVAVRPGEKYLTGGELFCLRDLFCAAREGSPEKESCLCTLREFYENRRPSEGSLDRYVFVMEPVAEFLEKRGEHEASDAIRERIRDDALFVGRML